MSAICLNLFLCRSKSYKGIVLSFLLFLWSFLNQNDTKINNVILLNEPIFCKITYFLNDSVCSIYVLVLTYFIFWKSLAHTNNKSIIVIAVYLYTTQIWWHNKNIFDYVFFTKLTNHTLVNGLLLIHPVLLYTGVTGIISVFIYWFFFKKFFLVLYKNIFAMKNKIYFYSGLSLFLGCYWAQQETNWGGWWNWDPVEFIAFVFWIYSIYYIHVFYKNAFIFYKYIILTSNLVLISYFLSRYDILNSIHSFAPSSKSSKYLEIKLLVILTIASYFYTLKSSIKFFKNNMLFLVTCFILLCIIYNICLQFLEISKNNLDYRTELILLLIFYYLYAYFLNIKTNSIALFATIYSYLYISILFFTNVWIFFKNKYKSHVLLLFSFVIIILFSRIDIFIKSYDYKSITGYLFNLNYKWFTTNYVNKNYCDFQSYIQSKTTLYSVFDLKKRFFYQTLLSNFSFNQNYVNINTTLVFFQQKLFLVSILLFLVSFYLLVSFSKKNLKAV